MSAPVLSPGVVPELGRRLLSDHLEDLAATLADLILGEIAEYAGHDRDDLMHSCRSNLRRSLQSVSGDLEDPRQLIDAPSETGRVRAHQGVPLDALLQSYRLGGRVLWEGLVREARRRPQDVDEGRLLDVATVLWQVVDTHSAAAAAAYRTEEGRLRSLDQRRQQVLLDALLEGRGVEAPLAAEAADVLGMRLDGPLLVVVAAFDQPGREPLRAPEEALSVRGIASAWRVRAGVEVGLLALPGGAASALEVLRAVAAGRVAASPVVRGAAAVGDAFRLAEAALRTLPADYVGLVELADRLPEAVLVSSGEVASYLVTEVLGPVLALRPRERAALLETLAAVLAVGGSPTHAAQRLYCHRNTVVKRLARMEALTGLSTSDARQRLVLTLAVLAQGLELGGQSIT